MFSGGLDSLAGAVETAARQQFEAKGVSPNPSQRSEVQLALSLCLQSDAVPDCIVCEIYFSFALGRTFSGKPGYMVSA